MLSRFTTSQGYTTDHLTGAVDPVPLSPEDWNARLHIANAHGTPFPRDREFWIVTEEADVRQVAYCADASWWMRREIYSRTDGESGSWEPDEILGWTDSYDDACEAAELLMAEACDG